MNGASEPRCGTDFETLIAWWLGELPDAQASAVEEHFFGCARCTRRLEDVAALGAAVRAAVHEGKVSLVVSARFVEAMKQAGLRLREYRLDAGGSVNCTIGAHDDAVISRLRAPLDGVKRLDLVRLQAGGAPQVRLADVPFDPQTGEVLVVPSAAWLKAMPAFTLRMQLVAVGEAGDRPIGEYTFNHSPS
jgi:anti-sigma factor RsiW